VINRFALIINQTQLRGDIDRNTEHALAPLVDKRRC
jgi:hypothetical protein